MSQGSSSMSVGSGSTSMDSSRAASSGVGAAALSVVGGTGTPCLSCGIDVSAAYEQVDRARRKLLLMQEKLDVEQELLKQDKKNFRRRLRAAKLATSNSQAAAEKQRLESEQAQEEAKKLQRECEEKVRQFETELKHNNEQHAKEIIQLQEQLKELQLHRQQENANTNNNNNNNSNHDTVAEPTNADLNTEQLESLNRQLLSANQEIARLKKDLEDKSIALQSYELQLLDFERERDQRTEPIHSESQSDPTQCKRLEQLLEQTKEQLDLTGTNLLAAESSLTEEKKQHQECRRELEKALTNSAALAAELEGVKEQLEGLRSHRKEYQATIQAKMQEIDELRAINQTLIQQQQESYNPSTLGKVSSAISNAQNGHTVVPNESTHRFVMEYEWLGPDVNDDSESIADNGSGQNELAGIYTGWLSSHDDCPDGNGTLRADNGAVYEGGWKRGRPHGRGVWVTLEGDIYSGEWERGIKTGKGVCIWSDGRVFRGSYQRNARHGSDCVMTWPYGAKYRGDFDNDKRKGQGHYVYADGRSYTGEYHDDRPHGYGTLKLADGTTKYQGQWERGEFLFGGDKPVEGTGSD